MEEQPAYSCSLSEKGKPETKEGHVVIKRLEVPFEKEPTIDYQLEKMNRIIFELSREDKNSNTADRLLVGSSYPNFNPFS